MSGLAGQTSLFPPEPAPDPLLCWLWLAHVLGPASVHAGRVLDAFGGAQEAWEARDTAEFRAAAGDAAALRAQQLDPEQYHALVMRCDDLGVRILPFDDPDYPLAFHLLAVFRGICLEYQRWIDVERIASRESYLQHVVVQAHVRHQGLQVNYRAALLGALFDVYLFLSAQRPELLRVGGGFNAVARRGYIGVLVLGHGDLRHLDIRRKRGVQPVPYLGVGHVLGQAEIHRFVESLLSKGEGEHECDIGPRIESLGLPDWEFRAFHSADNNAAEVQVRDVLRPACLGEERSCINGWHGRSHLPRTLQRRSWSTSPGNSG